MRGYELRAGELIVDQLVGAQRIGNVDLLVAFIVQLDRPLLDQPVEPVHGTGILVDREFHPRDTPAGLEFAFHLIKIKMGDVIPCRDAQIGKVDRFDPEDIDRCIKHPPLEFKQKRLHFGIPDLDGALSCKSGRRKVQAAGQCSRLVVKRDILPDAGHPENVLIGLPEFPYRIALHGGTFHLSRQLGGGKGSSHRLHGIRKENKIIRYGSRIEVGQPAIAPQSLVAHIDLGIKGAFSAIGGQSGGTGIRFDSEGIIGAHLERFPDIREDA